MRIENYSRTDHALGYYADLVVVSAHDHDDLLHLGAYFVFYLTKHLAAGYPTFSCQPMEAL